MVPLPPPLLRVASLRTQEQPPRPGAYPAQTREGVVGGCWLLRGGDPAGHLGHGLRACRTISRAPLVRKRGRRAGSNGATLACVVARRDDHLRGGARPGEGMDLCPRWPARGEREISGTRREHPSRRPAP